jgi:hypothetical protein
MEAMMIHYYVQNFDVETFYKCVIGRQRKRCEDNIKTEHIETNSVSYGICSCYEGEEQCCGILDYDAV